MALIDDENPKLQLIKSLALKLSCLIANFSSESKKLNNYQKFDVF